MRINRKHPLKEVMAAIDEYLEKTNRRITFEYIIFLCERQTGAGARIGCLVEGQASPFLREPDPLQSGCRTHQIRTQHQKGYFGIL